MRYADVIAPQGRRYRPAIALVLLLVLARPVSAQSAVDAWPRVQRTCASIAAFQRRFSTMNPHTKDAERLYRTLGCGTPARHAPPPTIADRREPTPHTSPMPEPSATRSPPDVAAAPYDLAIAAVGRSDYASARALFLRSCRQDEARGCSRYALSLANASADTYGQPDRPASRPWFERACRLDAQRSYCNNARIVWSMAAFGTPDGAKAREMFERSGMRAGALDCAMSAGEPCYVLGLAYRESASDQLVARGLLRSACEAGNTAGCTAAGEMTLGGGAALTTVEYASAERFFSRACDKSDRRACHYGLLLRGSAAFGLMDISIARRYFERSGLTVDQVDCSRQVKDRCFLLGLGYTDARYGKPDPTRAAQFQQRGCVAEYGASCGEAGRYEQLRGNLVAAGRLYAAACRLDDAKGCNAQAVLLSAPAYPAYDPAIARTAFAKACRLGYRAACTS